MKEKTNLLQWVTETMALPGEPIPGQPLVEIIGCNRVLIENHCGIRAYSSENIAIAVKFGCIEVCGCNLELSQMTKEQLIISGQIQSVTLHRRKMQ